jgi:hypothetical protein
MLATAMPDLVQFLHPGGEHGQDRPGFKDWNFGDHKRKFLLSEGTYVAGLRSKPRDGNVCFWGEWEPESEVTPIAAPVKGGPQWLHRPYYVRSAQVKVNGASEAKSPTWSLVWKQRSRARRKMYPTRPRRSRSLTWTEVVATSSHSTISARSSIAG